MAASSSSSIDHESFKYDVFLSFRGTDTRKNFVDHLYRALMDKAIYTYKDDERITKGQRISDELLRSIEDSRFYIVVFSKNYASSSWCLDELVKIMEECQKTKAHIAYPVFFDVEPTEVRHQTGAVGKAFPKHKNKKVAGKWRQALKQAANLAGWELKNTANGSEAGFIKKIIEAILLELDTINFSFDKNLVGMETRVNEILSSLQLGVDDVRMIGIKGMGGAGKTTLARAVFDKISIQFEGTSFVENVREATNDPSTGLKSLQQQMLRDVLHDKKIEVRGVHEGKKRLKQRMCGIKVLIALDDVDNIEQLEALAGDLEWFQSGSRIIITTRDEQVLVAHGVALIHYVNLLSSKEAISLFSKYAFRREGPVDQGYEELSEKVVSYASGLPLTIKVLGSLLIGKDKPEWEDALQRLETIPLDKTLKILELSYTALENDHKEIFLDVACMLKGWPKDYAIKALKSCGFHAEFGLGVLQQKSLITIYKGDHDEDERVGMHDHLEEMGRNIVRRLHPDEPRKHSRLWKQDEIEHILANDLGTEETRCIAATTEVDPYVVIKGLGKMKALRFLHVVTKQGYLLSFPDASDASGCLCLSLSDALGYLSWKHYPFRSLPKSFQANNLVTLKMQESKLEQLREGGEDKVLDKLRFLDLGWANNLRSLDLRLAPNLETLYLRGCYHLAELITGDEWTLKHLTSLDLSFCVRFEKLPEDLCQLGRLVKLDLSYTKIKHLPDWIWKSKQLKHLNLAGCKLLEMLPEDLGNFECLKDLDLSDTKIKHLPDSICKLKHLKFLDLSRCWLLEKLPEDLGNLECLEDLHLWGTKIKHLPDSICKLKHLKTLNLGGYLWDGNLPEIVTSISHLPQSILLLKGLKIWGPREFLQSTGFTISQIKSMYREIDDNWYYVEV